MVLKKRRSVFLILLFSLQVIHEVLLKELQTPEQWLQKHPWV